jgi:hypothetical protein
MRQKKRKDETKKRERMRQKKRKDETEKEKEDLAL